jgi:hypothetical protein
VSYEQWTNIKIIEIIFNCIPTGTLGAVWTDETETSGDLSCLLHFEVGNAKYLRF